MANQNNEPNTSADTYDRGIVPAETAARIEREGEAYKNKPQQAEDADLDTSAGFTVDQEGLVNNYAVEPEMYYDQPGDRKAEQEELAAERARNAAEVNQTDETGKLESGRDDRGRGTGVI